MPARTTRATRRSRSQRGSDVMGAVCSERARRRQETVRTRRCGKPHISVIEPVGTPMVSTSSTNEVLPRGVDVGEHRADPTVHLALVDETELEEHGADVLLHGPLAHV